MTNEEAIRRIECCRNFLANNYSDMGEPNFTAFNIAIKALEQEQSGDAISRQAVLDYIDKMPSELAADGRRMIRRRTLEEYISDTLPPVNPQEPKWIPVGERLPEHYQNILFSTKTDRVFEGRYFKDETEHQWYSFRDECFAWNNVVTAWMPLPKPYEPQERSEKK